MSPIQIFEHYLAHGAGIATCLLLVGLTVAFLMALVLGVVAWAKREPAVPAQIDTTVPVPSPRNE